MIDWLLSSRTGSFTWAVLVGLGFAVLLPPEIWIPVIVLTALVRLSVAAGLLVGVTLPPMVVLVVTGVVLGLGLLAALWPYLMGLAYLSELSELDEQEVDEALANATGTPPHVDGKQRATSPQYADETDRAARDLDTTPLQEQ